MSRARLEPSAVLNHECTLAGFASGPQMFPEHLPGLPTPGTMCCVSLCPFTGVLGLGSTGLHTPLL